MNISFTNKTLLICYNDNNSLLHSPQNVMDRARAAAPYKVTPFPVNITFLHIVHTYIQVRIPT